MTTYLSPNGIPYSGDPICRDDGTIDPEIPDRPTIHHVWKNGEWTLEPWYDWAGLKDALRGTEIFSKSVSTTNQNAFALLMNTFDSKPRNGLDMKQFNLSKMPDFVWAISAVREGLAVDYSEEQLETFRGLLQEYGFPIFL